MKTTHYHVTSVTAAWQKANEIMPGDYMQDARRTERAGYPVYMGTIPGRYDYICDLETRLEVNLDDGSTVNIWIDETPEPTPINAERVMLDVSRQDVCKLLIACTGIEWDMRDEMRDDATTEGRRAVLRESIKMWHGLHDMLKNQLDRHDAKNGVSRL